MHGIFLIEHNAESFDVSHQHNHLMLRKHNSGNINCLLAFFSAEWISSLISTLVGGTAFMFLQALTAVTFAEAPESIFFFWFIVI